MRGSGMRTEKRTVFTGLPSASRRGEGPGTGGSASACALRRYGATAKLRGGGHVLFDHGSTEMITTAATSQKTSMPRKAQTKPRTGEKGSGVIAEALLTEVNGAGVFAEFAREQCSLARAQHTAREAERVSVNRILG